MVVEDNVNKSGDDSDNSKKNDNLGSSSELNFSFGDTLYLHPNDTGGSPIVNIKLTRTESYKMWSIAMTFALRNHNKICFILNSLSPDLFVGAIYAKAAYEMWNDLKETYDKVDGSTIFNLHKSINSLKQNGYTLDEYYNNLNSLWKQFDAMIILDKSYLEIRSNILARKHLPLIKAAFVVVSGEESHRNATSVEATKPVATTFVAKTFDNKRRSNNNNNFNRASSSKSNSNNRGPNPNLKCTNCNKIAHIVDRCFELVGYHVGFIKRNFNANTRYVSSNNDSADVHSNNASSNNATTNNSPVSLSNEHLSSLMSLLNGI
ncbi:hypothetical protein Tco_0534319 [Tanacetum coccineum]